jgi:hypothetical protein
MSVTTSPYVGVAGAPMLGGFHANLAASGLP